MPDCLYFSFYSGTELAFCEKPEINFGDGTLGSDKTNPWKDHEDHLGKNSTELVHQTILKYFIYSPFVLQWFGESIDSARIRLLDRVLGEKKRNLGRKRLTVRVTPILPSRLIVTCSSGLILAIDDRKRDLGPASNRFR